MNEIETIYDEVSGFADGKNSLVSGNGGYRILKTSMDPQNNDLGRLPLVRTGRPDQSICKENSTFNQNCPARSVYFYIVCIAVMRVERKLSKEAYFIFKMTAPTGQFGLLVSALSKESQDKGLFPWYPICSLNSSFPFFFLSSVSFHFSAFHKN